MTSFEVESGPTIMNVRSVDVRVKMMCGGRGWISPVGGIGISCHSGKPKTLRHDDDGYKLGDAMMR